MDGPYPVVLRESSVVLRDSVVSRRFERIPVHHGVTEIHGEFTERLSRPPHVRIRIACLSQQDTAEESRIVKLLALI